MRIVIRDNGDNGSRKFTIRLPNFLFRFATFQNLINFGKKQQQKIGGDVVEISELSEVKPDLKISQTQISEMLRILKRMKKEHPGVPLVEVKEVEGSGITIYP